MAIKITDDAMISDVTPHSAAFSLHRGADGKGAWVVTWLPSRALTYNQAITAMTIAEAVAEVVAEAVRRGQTGHPAEPSDNGPWWQQMKVWANELHVSATFAFAACEDAVPDSGPLLAEPAAPAPRANRDGDPCPTWCTIDHNELLIPKEPEFGYMSVHQSHVLLEPAIEGVRVMVAQSPGRPPVVTLTAKEGRVGLEFTVKNARILADILQVAGPPSVADALQAAAGIIAGVMLRAAK